VAVQGPTSAAAVSVVVNRRHSRTTGRMGTVGRRRPWPASSLWLHSIKQPGGGAPAGDDKVAWEDGPLEADGTAARGWGWRRQREWWWRQRW